jgi:hypothetical protein
MTRRLDPPQRSSQHGTASGFAGAEAILALNVRPDA